MKIYYTLARLTLTLTISSHPSAVEAEWGSKSKNFIELGCRAVTQHSGNLQLRSCEWLHRSPMKEWPKDGKLPFPGKISGRTHLLEKAR